MSGIDKLINADAATNIGWVENSYLAAVKALRDLVGPEMALTMTMDRLHPILKPPGTGIGDKARSQLSNTLCSNRVSFESMMKERDHPTFDTGNGVLISDILSKMDDVPMWRVVHMKLGSFNDPDSCGDLMKSLRDKAIQWHAASFPGKPDMTEGQLKLWMIGLVIHTVDEEELCYSGGPRLAMKIVKVDDNGNEYD
ncbi:MAG: hypothetical protein SGILL_000740 [Bacillariaceae sp.]